MTHQMAHLLRARRITHETHTHSCHKKPTRFTQRRVLLYVSMIGSGLLLYFVACVPLCISILAPSARPPLNDVMGTDFLADQKPPPSIESGLFIGVATVGVVAVLGAGLFAFLWRQSVIHAQPTFEEPTDTSSSGIENFMNEEP
eukprot:Gregarina_sp_Poly_1__574@NODE_1137_length_4975_cov_105_293602_g667_i2_p5_GENE_NODE_1137_length_4975_cov_105_293602_g667_i2NODE_1137_length_4975_cov_105_293602_g667_i2_p5_ORF_typecomplete_len144_score9_31DUF2456/PF10445_9/0_89DUF2456/PF10445_9/2_3e02AIRC/PF00731_20/1_4AIRC/PF00731_20/3_3e02Phage_holin_3_6/PF07332_11/0_52DUF2207/PF09972_9/0_52HIG_1_N/PF04588_13/0_56_NODE_1137_length_4975_cov_105_293602_g667_i227043135